MPPHQRVNGIFIEVAEQRADLPSCIMFHPCSLDG